jgi:hypothetical protein
VGLVGIPFGCDCLDVDGGVCCLAGVFGACRGGLDVDSGKGAKALNGRCGCPVFECRSCTFALGLLCCDDPGSAGDDALTCGGLTDGEDVAFVGVDIFGLFEPDRFGVTVLFADAIPYALAGTIVVVVVTPVVVVDDFDLGGCFVQSSSLL